MSAADSRQSFPKMRLWPFFQQASTLPLPSSSCTAPLTPLQLRVLSFNIRYATTSLFTNEKPWSDRFPLVLNQLQHETRFTDGGSSDAENSTQHAASIICLQEVLHTQLVDIMNGLNGLPSPSNKTAFPADGPIWSHVGVGRDDGKTAGEYSPVLYPTRIFDLLHFETVWLSPTPDKPSKGWDAGSIRILTISVLEHKSTKQRLLASATHLDNVGSESRKHSISIILDTLKRISKDWSINGVLPIVLAGDFNSLSTQEAYLSMAQSDYMYDLREFVRAERRYNDGITFTGFQPDKNQSDQGRIDFIWLGPKNAVCGLNETQKLLSPTGSNGANDRSWLVDGYAVLPNVFDNGIFLSDHRSVVGDVRLLL